jgi:hypothetical protein
VLSFFLLTMAYALVDGLTSFSEKVVSCFIYSCVYIKGNTTPLYDSAIQYIVCILENAISVLKTRFFFKKKLLFVVSAYYFYHSIISLYILNLFDLTKL